MTDANDYQGRMYATRAGLRIIQIIGVFILFVAISSLRAPLTWVGTQRLAVPAVAGSSLPGTPSSAATIAKSLFVTMGCGVTGALILWWATRHLMWRERMEALQRQHPEAPWLWRDDWGSRRIYSAGRSRSLILVAAAAIYLLVVLPASFGWQWLNDRPIWTKATTIMMVVGWPVFNLGRQYGRRYWRFDNGVFFMDGETGVVGGPLSGTVYFPRPLPSDITLRVSLECVSLTRTGSQRKTQIREEVIWSNSWELVHTWAFEPGKGHSAPIYCEIPFECQPTLNGRSSIYWQLKVGPAGQELMREYAVFEVPVFRTAKSTKGFRGNRDRVERFEKSFEPQEVVDAAGLRTQSYPNGTVVIETSLYRPMIAQGLVIGIIFFGGLVVAAIMLGYPWLGIIPGLVIGLLLYGGLELLFWRSHVEFSAERLMGSSGFPWRCVRFELSTDDVQAWRVEQEFSTENSTYYLVRLVTSDGPNYVVARRLATRDQAELVAEHYAAQMREVAKTSKGKPLSTEQEQE